MLCAAAAARIVVRRASLSEVTLMLPILRLLVESVVIGVVVVVGVVGSWVSGVMVRGYGPKSTPEP